MLSVENTSPQPFVENHGMASFHTEIQSEHTSHPFPTIKQVLR